MKIKSIFFGLSFLMALSSVSFAHDTITPTKKGEVVLEQIKKMVTEIANEADIHNDHTVQLRFMINDNNEIIVLNTDDSELDYALKAELNYKKVDTNDLKPYAVYVTNIRFKTA